MGRVTSAQFVIRGNFNWSFSSSSSSLSTLCPRPLILSEIQKAFLSSFRTIESMSKQKHNCTTSCVTFVSLLCRTKYLTDPVQDQISIRPSTRPKSPQEPPSIFSRDIWLNDNSGTSLAFARNVHIAGWTSVGDKLGGAYVVYDCVIRTKEVRNAFYVVAQRSAWR